MDPIGVSHLSGTDCLSLCEREGGSRRNVEGKLWLRLPVGRRNTEVTEQPHAEGSFADRGWSRQPSPEGVQTDADVDPPDPDTGRSAEVPPVSNRRTTVGSLFSSYMMASLKAPLNKLMKNEVCHKTVYKLKSCEGLA
uniref:Uncharacterized protein n=1 Tax=Magallana gigas TaxID=29159 RepID=A0A8W8MVT1_MAGGI